VGKKAVTEHFFARPITKLEQSVSVERNNPTSRRAAQEAITKRSVDYRLPPLIVFAEGTTSSTNSLLPFKRGVFVPRQPLMLICLSFLNRTGGGIQEMSYGGIVEDLYFPLCNFVNFVRIDILPTYYPTEVEKQNTHLFAENVRNVLCAELGRHFPAALLAPFGRRDMLRLFDLLKFSNCEQLIDLLSYYREWKKSLGVEDNKVKIDELISFQKSN